MIFLLESSSSAICKKIKVYMQASRLNRRSLPPNLGELTGQNEAFSHCAL